MRRLGFSLVHRERDPHEMGRGQRLSDAWVAIGRGGCWHGGRCHAPRYSRASQAWSSAGVGFDTRL